MKNEDLLKEKRANLLSEMIDKIKLSIETNKVNGENSSKIFIYSRLADYTYYSEVSIRKFLTGTVPKDIASFVEGVIQYCKLVGVEEEYIENFTKEYVQASNAVVLEVESSVKTKNNLIPQDLTSIIRPGKLSEFINKFLKEEINIAYIYGYRLSGKTKSVMACMSDLVNKNIYDSIIWTDIKQEEGQIKQIINSISSFALLDKEQLDENAKKAKCLDFLKTNKSIIVLDFNNLIIEEETLKILKEIAKNSKIIIISSTYFKNYENELSFYAKAFCTNDYIQKEEFEQMLKLNEQSTSIVENEPDIVNKLYKLTGGFPFASIYILKKIIEENGLGVSLNEAIEKYSNYNLEEYEELAEKIIAERWEKLSALAKKIMIICAKFNYSVSIKLIANICEMKVTDSEWKQALKQCYENDLLSTIILNNARVYMNNMIKTLVLQYEDKVEFNNTLFLDRIGNYYLDLATYIGECYDDLDKLKLLDELDEWNIVLQVLEYLKQAGKNKEYIGIVRELKYYIYVRGMWEIGENSLHLKRADLAHKIDDVNEELEGLCDYINICSKSKNHEEAEKYLEIASKIVEKNEEKINKRIICLYNHVKALYLYNCKKEYQICYDIWKNNKEKYSQYVSTYRNLVNDLWITRSYIKIEKDFEKVCKELENKIIEMQKENFVRAEIDYELLLIGVLIPKLKENEKELIKRIEAELDKCEYLFNTKSYKDIRNEAQYFRYRAMIYAYKKEEQLKNEYCKKAIEDYKLMNCHEDIENLKETINSIK